MSGHPQHTHADGTGPLPIVCAWRRELGLDGGASLPGDELVSAVRRFISDLLRTLGERGCRLIGHVKGLVEAGDAGRLLFSATSFDGEPSIRAELRGPVGECSFTVNAIVFGGEDEGVAAAVLDSARRQLGPWRLAP